MFPYSDNLALKGSWMTVGILIFVLMLTNIGMFVIPGMEEKALRHLGFYPVLFSYQPWKNIHTLITSPIVHADIFHIAGNCLFLWVFGRSLERLFGSLLFMGLFPFLGAAGLLFHWAIDPGSTSPVIGASGAVATLMGAYLTLFPHARIKLIFFFGYFFKRFSAPAWVFLLYWSGLQMLSFVMRDGSSDSVAYAVHIGGFMAGVVGAMIWKVTYPSAEEKLESFQTASFLPKKI